MILFFKIIYIFLNINVKYVIENSFLHFKLKKKKDGVTNRTIFPKVCIKSIVFHFGLILIFYKF